MDKRNTRFLYTFVAIIFATNLFLAVTQVDWAQFADRPSLDFSKDFGSEIVLVMQELAAKLGVAEKANIKQALAKLHYDVYMATSNRDLAGIIQTTASDTRDLIISEYVNSSAEQVLKILNDAPEVRSATDNLVIRIVPRLQGGYRVVEPTVLGLNTLTELSSLTTLFSLDTFKAKYDSYLALTSLQIEIEDGIAQRVIPKNDQDTIKYWEREIQNLRTDYNKVAKLAGSAEAAGPGISVTLYDKYFPVEAGDLRRIVSEFYSAGATAISINGHRLAVNSFIIEDNGGISVDGMLISTNPIEIMALGDPRILLSGVDLLFNVVFQDFFYTIMNSHENLVLPGKSIQ